MVARGLTTAGGPRRFRVRLSASRMGLPVQLERSTGCAFVRYFVRFNLLRVAVDVVVAMRPVQLSLCPRLLWLDHTFRLLRRLPADPQRQRGCSRHWQCTNRR